MSEKRPSSKKKTSDRQSGSASRDKNAHRSGEVGSAQGRTPTTRLDADSGRYTSLQQPRPEQNKPKTQNKSSQKKNVNKSAVSPKQNSKTSAPKKEINWSLLSKLAFAAIVVALVVMLLVFQRVETETALLVTMSNNIETTGYAVRNETIITTTKTGTFVSAVKNGSKVSKGEVIVNIFDSADAAVAYQRVLEINEALEDFEYMKTAGEDNAAEISAIKKQMDTKLLEFSKNIANGDISDACELSEDILYFFNKNQIATKIVEGFDDRVAELSNEKRELESGYSIHPQSISSPLSGYFIDRVDGYEELLNSGILEGLTPELLEATVARRKEPVSAGIIGKIADGYKWNIVCIVAADKAALLTEGKSYTIYFPYSEVESVSAKLLKINPDELGERSLLNFECTNMVSELSTLRNQQITIELNKTTGLEVNKSSLVTRTYEKTVSSSDGRDVTVSEEQNGVYILWDNEIKFKRVEIIYELDGKVLCAQKTGSAWLKLYDEVILDTENMYDGKIVNNGR